MPWLFSDFSCFDMSLLLLTVTLRGVSYKHCLLSFFFIVSKLSLVMRKPAFCVCENKDADQLGGNREADQRLCFRYTDSTIPQLPKYEITSL